MGLWTLIRGRRLLLDSISGKVVVTEKRDMTEPIYPFRWKIAERSQIATLLEATEALWEKEMDPYKRKFSRRRDRRAEMGRALPWWKRRLIPCCARVLSFCGDSDLVFVGRSPEILFDYMSGLLWDTSWRDRLTLLHFSSGRPGGPYIDPQYAGNIPMLRPYLESVGLSPHQLARRKHSIALVDIVASGDTFGALVKLLREWCEESGADWPACRRKIRIVGLLEQEKPSPHTRRWWQSASWVRMLEPANIKNVTISWLMFRSLGGDDPKTTISYSPELWGDADVQTPRRDLDTLSALWKAVALYDAGRSRTDRLALAREMSKQTGMRYPWFRELVLELKR
jgi:hypothetical protein